MTTKTKAKKWNWAEAFLKNKDVVLGYVRLSHGEATAKVITKLVLDQELVRAQRLLRDTWWDLLETPASDEAGFEALAQLVKEKAE